MFLDNVCFKDQRFDLGVGGNDLDIGDFLHHHGYARLERRDL